MCAPSENLSTKSTPVAEWVSLQGRVGETGYVRPGEPWFFGTGVLRPLVPHQVSLELDSCNMIRIDSDVTLEPYVRIYKGVTVKRGAFIGSSTTLFTGAFIGQGAHIGLTCHIGRGARIPPGTFIPSYSTVPARTTWVQMLGRERRGYPVLLARVAVTQEEIGEMHVDERRLLRSDGEGTHHYYVISAGCRLMTLPQALQHWGDDYNGAPRDARFMRVILRNIGEILYELEGEFYDTNLMLSIRRPHHLPQVLSFDGSPPEPLVRVSGLEVLAPPIIASAPRVSSEAGPELAAVDCPAPECTPTVEIEDQMQESIRNNRFNEELDTKLEQLGC